MLGKEILEHGEHQHDKSFDNLFRQHLQELVQLRITLSFWMC